MGHCKDCRYWEPTTPYGVCHLLSIGYAPSLPETGGLAYLAPDDPFTEASLLTLPDFGCVLFEAKEG